jgi:polyferredoxin
MNHFIPFLKKLVILTVVVELIYLACIYFLEEKYVSKVTAVIPIFFMCITVLIHKNLLNTLNKPPKKFFQLYMVVSMVKLLGLLTIVLIYSILRPYDAIQFIGYFFFSYLIFTYFESRSLTKL